MLCESTTRPWLEQPPSKCPSPACYRCPFTCGLCPAESAATGEISTNLLIRLPPFLSDPSVESPYRRAWERVLAKAALEHDAKHVSLVIPILSTNPYFDTNFLPQGEVIAYTESQVETSFTPLPICIIWVVFSAASSLWFIFYLHMSYSSHGALPLHAALQLC